MRQLIPQGLLLALCLSFRQAHADGLTESWSLKTGSYVDSSAAIDSKSNLYLTVSGTIRFSDIAGGKLIAISPVGVQKWVFGTRLEIQSSPALADDGTIYFGCRDRKIYAISPEGTLKWSFTSGAWVDSSPAIATDGTIYFGSWDRKFYALNPDGSKRWEFPTGGPIDSSPAIGTNGLIYFGSHDHKFYALNPDGRNNWVFTTEGAIISSPALDADGTIYFTSVDGRLYALSPDGRKKWDCWTGGTRKASPIIDGLGNICLGVNDTFVSFSSEGKKVGWFGYPAVEGAGAALADGTILFTGTDEGVGKLYSWTPDGVMKGVTSVGGPITGSLSLSPDGTVYIGASGNGFHAYRGTAYLAKSPWPKFRGNLFQNGRAPSR
jgi:outer membrane protein assembly factor BamB